MPQVESVFESDGCFPLFRVEVAGVRVRPEDFFPLLRAGFISGTRETRGPFSFKWDGHGPSPYKTLEKFLL